MMHPETRMKMVQVFNVRTLFQVRFHVSKTSDTIQAPLIEYYHMVDFRAETWNYNILLKLLG